MTSLRVHFDGRVLVPEEPVDLPLGESLEILLPEKDANSFESADDNLFDKDPRTGFLMFRVPEGTRTVTAEEIREAEDED